MAIWKLLLTSFAVVYIVFFDANSAYAAKSSKIKLSCPASWPEAPSSRLTRVDFTTFLNLYAPLNFYENPEPYGAKSGDELFCVYANGRSLLITIPGKPDICYIVKVARIGSKSVTTDAYCTFTKLGDPAKDSIHIRETEPLTRATSIDGVKLGMTHDEVVASITPQVAPARPNTQEIYVLPDTQQLVVNYDGVDDAPGNVIMLKLTPALGRLNGMVNRMRERFGFPDVNGEPDGPMVWRGQDGVRLAVYVDRMFGNRAFQEEYAFLIDGRKISGLDKQLKLDGGD